MSHHNCDPLVLMGRLSLIAALVTLVGATLQETGEQQTSKIRALVDQLLSDELEVRTHAEQQLRRLDPSCVPTLESTLVRLQDLEAESRLQEVIKHLLLTEAKKLYGQAMLPESLRKHATAMGAKDADVYVAERVRDAKAEVARLLPSKEQAQGHIDYDDLVKKARTSDPWVFPVLVEMLRGEDPRNQMHSTWIFMGLGGDGAPALAWALRTGTVRMRGTIISVLGRLPNPSPGATPGVIEALKDVFRDTSESSHIRTAARNAIIRFTGRPPDE